MTKVFFAGPVHHEIIVSVPWVTQWKAQMLSADDAIEVFLPGTDASMQLSALPTAFASSMDRGLETVSQGKRSEEAPIQCIRNEGNDGDVHAPPRRNGLVKILEEFDQLNTEAQKKLEKLEGEFSDVLNNKELPACRPPAGFSMHPIELIPGAAQRYRRPPTSKGKLNGMRIKF
ncbi:uncharacterized protein EMH_0052600 [Eimeria mitis]|uniref:Uncharacterized protein n=1 Tax=Eimeria mitis TaxID=44415 RepID=U6JYE1_9EIME|nr:uncharacterized protein EMH_0052600 [Eimeria mitis]CDJ29776.1 hypothetical protein EMH_0052600 [Eimeria mitis]